MIETKIIEQIKKQYFANNPAPTAKSLAARFKVAEAEVQALLKTLPPIKKYYEIKINTMLPAVLTYRVLAETPEQAAELIKHQSPNGVNYKLVGRKDIKLTVYESGSSIIKFIKNLLGH